MRIREDTGEVISDEANHSVMMLTKLLFRFEIINEEQALNMATKFRILFV